jgi:hypothetical protein
MEQAVDEEASSPDKLKMLQLADWDKEQAYDGDPPSCIHYSIEWKVTVNNRVVSKDTEQDVVLAPASYWRKYSRIKPELVLKPFSAPADNVMMTQ